MSQSNIIDERTVEVIATRVANAVKQELVEIATGIRARNDDDLALTVDDVAARFCVSRSTVYAHWREWGGYKLGSGDKAAIRFSPNSLPTQPASTSPPTAPNSRRARGPQHLGGVTRHARSATPRHPPQ